MSKMSECRSISKMILDEYRELKTIITSYGEDSVQFKEKIKGILRLVIDEYRMYQGIKYPQYQMVQEGAKFQDSSATNDFDFLSYQARVMLKLDEVCSISGNICFSFDEVFPHLNSIFSDIKLPMNDVMCSCLEMEALKKIDKIVNDVSNMSILDDMFVSAVLNEHMDTLIHYFSMRLTSEILALSYDYDFSKIPEFNYTMYINAIKRKYGYQKLPLDMSKLLDDGLKEMVLHTLKLLTSIEDVSATPEEYYEYILYTGFIEVYISYMSYEKKKELSDELKNIAIKDTLVRKKMKNLLSRKKKNDNQ